MSSIPRVSLEDTLYLLQLVRETALSRGEEAKAARIAPVVQEMGTLVEKARQVNPAPPPASGILGQPDFKKLLEISQNRTLEPSQPGMSAASVGERNRMIVAMAAAEMSDIEIARQFGLTREEVRLVLNAQKNQPVR
ncbi:MAG TPA: hypothetical protein DEQ80_00330 [Anaerolinea thermolimosa]|uniref:Uncharacterized protein n=1 Tax=Anaerolinea thermolimosa TaxID=229919 RepID=A0A3D1JCG8_9CHLR|nr:hypothetical protein [Anaerolinea thermolimosa]GAP07904.1 hypothetical protein ATHL_02800 [Anaerolinea thermolimosa]HCE16279.1 hypothetical protein [Anaerolinea thermolimosa]